MTEEANVTRGEMIGMTIVNMMNAGEKIEGMTEETGIGETETIGMMRDRGEKIATIEERVG